MKQAEPRDAGQKHDKANGKKRDPKCGACGHDIKECEHANKHNSRAANESCGSIKATNVLFHRYM